MEPERVELTPQQEGHAFTREQKVGYALVIACGVLAVVFGMFYLVSHLHRPFIITYAGSHVLTTDEKNAEEALRQQRSDTDEDTVSDYDELYVYKTSPYIADTDSDGLTDDVEIMSNQDPTCAIGAACEDETNEVRREETAFDDDAAAAAAAAQEAASQYEAIQAMLENLSVGEIRSILIESGADTAQIEAMSDDEIAALYQEVLGQLQEQGGMEEILGQLNNVASQ